MAQVTLRTKLEKLLKRRFPKSDVTLENGTALGKLGAVLVWKGFIGKDQVDRQRAVREVLAEELTDAERRKLSAIFTMTPDEMAVIAED